MKYSLNNDSETKVSIAVTLDKADLAKIKQKTLPRLARSLKVAGFRPGKTPLSIAEKNIDPNILNTEIAKDAVNYFVVEMLDKEQLQPLDQPKIDLSKYVPDQLLECSVVIEKIPAIKLGDYKNLSAKSTAQPVTDKEIDEITQRLRSSSSKKQTTDRVAKMSDEVLIDFSAKDSDGKQVPGTDGKDYELLLGSGNFIPGFEDAIVGKKAGETFELPITFPSDYHHEPLANAKVTFTVSIKEVREVVLPELDDAFAATCGPFKSLADMQADIKRELTNQKEHEALDKLKDQLVMQLVNGSHVPTPDILIADQMTGLEQDFVQNLQYRSQTLDQYLAEQKLSIDEWRDKTLRAQAIKRVEIGLVLAELSKVEDISVSKAELDARLQELLQSYGNDAKIRDQLSTPESKRDLTSRLISEKTVTRLVELNR
ncbi:MAG TPA: trigger factor [Patescibacteria group bacterium]|jgi:trigger factor|nr:trigger factor [Patescibacteria group bacterium]